MEEQLTDLRKKLHEAEERAQRSNGGPDLGTYYNCKRYDFKFHDSKYQVT
jgi:hypothetical protein